MCGVPAGANGPSCPHWTSARRLAKHYIITSQPSRDRRVRPLPPGGHGIIPRLLSRGKGVSVGTQTVSLHRWDELALEKVTEMISRKIVTGEREMVAQVYLKKGALVPMHSHESEQMTYVLQGALKFLINGEEITVREGEVLHIPSWIEHQAEALDDTFELDLFSPIRQDWLDHTDTYFHRQ
jgi:quercetin dioxygenase-like cupin family protein